MSWRERKRRLRAHLDNDTTREWARRVVNVAIGAEVVVQLPIDRCMKSPGQVPTGQLTAIIKTFERPREVRRLIASIRRTHADVPVLVVDDSRRPEPIDGAELLSMPYNSGISAGRNAALEQISTPYFLILDDDFVFYRHTTIARSLATISAHPEIDILGGRVINLPDFSSYDYLQSRQQYSEQPPTHPPGSLVAGLPVYSKVPNFFIGRTESVRKVGWHPELKVMEHQEFFDRAYGVLTTVYDRQLRVLHARNPFDRATPERQANMRTSAVVLDRIRRERRTAGLW